MVSIKSQLSEVLDKYFMAETQGFFRDSNGKVHPISGSNGDQKMHHFIERGENVWHDQTRGQAKNTLVTDIAKRMGNDPETVKAVQDMKGKSDPQTMYDTANYLVRGWAAMAGQNNNPTAIAHHIATAKEFGLDSRPFTKDRSAVKKANDLLSSNNGAYERMYRGYLRAEYGNTQDQLKDAGIDKVTLTRGMTWDSDSAPKWVSKLQPRSDSNISLKTGPEDEKRSSPLKLRLQPVTSWTANQDTAVPLGAASTPAEMYQRDLGRSYFVNLKAEVPREKILSTARTGRGALPEYEVTVLGGPTDVKATRLDHSTGNSQGKFASYPSGESDRVLFTTAASSPTGFFRDEGGKIHPVFDGGSNSHRSGGGVTPLAHASETPLLKKLVEDGGFTFHTHTGEQPTEGFAVSIHQDREAVFDGIPSTSDLHDFMAKNEDILSNPDHFMGAWNDKANGQTNLDVSVIKQNRGEAEKLAQDNHQEAIFDLGKGEDIHIGARQVDRFGDSDTLANNPQPVVQKDIRDIAQKYVKEAGLNPVHDFKPQTLQPEEGRKIADAYEKAKDSPGDPVVREAYDALNKEVQGQYDALTAGGMKIEPWEKAGQPYQTSTEMKNDVDKNHHLYYFKSGGEGNQPTSLMSLEQNDRFRAVHDIFGHAQVGNQFGPVGETNAYLEHSQMFSPKALRALTTETVAQNATYNFGKNNEGKPAEERTFPSQKATLIPEELVSGILGRRDKKSSFASPPEEDYFACPCHKPAKKTKLSMIKVLEEVMAVYFGEPEGYFRDAQGNVHPINGSGGSGHGAKSGWNGKQFESEGSGKTLAIGRSKTVKGTRDETSDKQEANADEMLRSIGMTRESLTATYKKYISEASPEEVEAGKKWYSGMRDFGKKLSETGNMPLHSAIGTIAGLSPHNSYDRNLEDAKVAVDVVNGKFRGRELGRGGQKTKLMDEPISKLTIDPQQAQELYQRDLKSTMKERKANALNAQNYHGMEKNHWGEDFTGTHDVHDIPGDVLAAFVPHLGGLRNNFARSMVMARGGDPDKILQGSKVRSFYNNGLDPEHDASVTIDTHMIAMGQGQARTGYELNDKVPASVFGGVAKYKAFADAVRAATPEGMQPHQAQAILWLHHKNMGLEKFKPGGSKVKTGKHWGD